MLVIPFKDEAEAIALANNTPQCLAAHLQTGDTERRERVAAYQRWRLWLWLTVWRLQAVWEGGVHGLEDYQEIRTLHFG